MTRSHDVKERKKVKRGHKLPNQSLKSVLRDYAQLADDSPPLMIWCGAEESDDEAPKALRRHGL